MSMCRPKPVLHDSRAKGIGHGKMILTSRTLKIWRQIWSPESLWVLLDPYRNPVRRLTDSISYSNQITNLLSRSNSIRVAGISAQPTSPKWFVHFVNWFIFNGLNEWIGTTSAIQVVADEPAMGYVEWKKVKISIGWPDLKHFLFAKRTSSGDFVCC